MLFTQVISKPVSQSHESFFTRTLKVISSAKTPLLQNFKSIVPPTVSCFTTQLFVRKNKIFFGLVIIKEWQTHFSSEWRPEVNTFVLRRNRLRKGNIGGWQSGNACTALTGELIRDPVSGITCSSCFCKPGFLKVVLKFTYGLLNKNGMHLDTSCIYISIWSWLELARQHFWKLDHIYLTWGAQRLTLEAQKCFLLLLFANDTNTISRTLFQPLKV